MPNWMRWLVVFLVIVAAAYYWLLVESHVPSGDPYSIDLPEVRRLANTIPGAKPGSIRVEQVATFTFPTIAMMAGDSWKSLSAPAASYQIVYPDRTVIIDTAMDEKLTNSTGWAKFNPEPYTHMVHAMASASLILITHEHLDHIGGIATYPDPAGLVSSIRLTREQISHPERMAPAVLPSVPFQVIDYDRYHAAAPGIVLIKSPGHSPGSQMIFVQKADGTEYLFLGDIAWEMPNVEHVRGRPRAISMFMLHEDRAGVLRQLAELHRLMEAEPKLHMLAGHDARPIEALEQQGLMAAGFQ
jgi:glyoxylase-like metal-dependent hydrolase (beta-lactamase superfamily II)